MCSFLQHPDAAPSANAVGSRPLLLRAQGLRKAFGGQSVLDGIDLELRQGEVVLLRGENGSGKTTLLNILTGNIEPDAGMVEYLADGTPRAYHFPRRWWQELNPFDHFTPEFVAREGIGRTWQDIRLFGSQSLRDNIAVAEPANPGENPLVALIPAGRTSRRESVLSTQADAMLASLGLSGRESSSADMVSLGQSKRVAIARAVAAGAKVLFLDEPLAGLDRPGIRDVLVLLDTLIREQHITLVVVEHIFNQSHLQGLVTTDWSLNGGKLRHNGVATLQSSGSDLRSPSITRPAWIEMLAGPDADIIDEELPRGAILTRIRRSALWRSDAKPVLEMKDLIVKRGNRTVIGLDSEGRETGFNISFYDSEIAILQAPNGWGKSTLFDVICGNAHSVTGSISINGQSVESMPTWERARAGLSGCPSATSIFPSLKAGEASRLAAQTQTPGAVTVPFTQRTISSLSGGERQRVLLHLVTARALQAHVSVFDEPFANLDGSGSRDFAATLSRRSGASLLLIPSPTFQ